MDTKNSEYSEMIRRIIDSGYLSIFSILLIFGIFIVNIVAFSMLAKNLFKKEKKF